MKISRDDFMDCFEHLCQVKGVKVNPHLAKVWFTRLGNFTQPAVVDALEHMISGVRGFPTLDEVMGWLNGKHLPVGAKPMYEDPHIPPHDQMFTHRMLPTMMRWIKGEITNHRYFQEMKLHADDLNVHMNWQEFVDMGYSLPWVEQSRYPGDANARIKDRRPE